MLRDYFKWWTDQMLALVPERMRQLMVETQEYLLVEPDADGEPFVRLTRIRHRDAGDLGRFPLDPTALQAVAWAGRGGAVHLRLAAPLLLEKQLTLPLAAARELDHVLSYEMDRETPFSVDDVWWSFAVEHRDRQHGKVVVRLSLVPKAAIDGLLGVLRQAGLGPALLDIDLEDGEHRQIPVDAPRRHDGRARSRAVPLAAAACAVLAAIAIVLPFARQYWALAAIRSEMAGLKPTVDEAEKLRRQIDQSAGSDVLTAERSRLGDPLAVLAAATSLLPDDTHLSDFTMEQRKVLLNGQSVGAAKLIGAFAADPTFKDPAFAAPSTHMEGARTETFSIGAEARP
jgi:general secretion pathway protein L